MNTVNKDRILMLSYSSVNNVEYAEFKINKQILCLVNRTGEWKSVNVPNDYPTLVHCKADMIAIINSAKKMRYLLGDF